MSLSIVVAAAYCCCYHVGCFFESPDQDPRGEGPIMEWRYKAKCPQLILRLILFVSSFLSYDSLDGDSGTKIDTCVQTRGQDLFCIIGLGFLVTLDRKT